MTLYELTDQFRELLDMMEDPDVDIDAVLDTADAVEMDFNDKADGYAKVIFTLKAEAEVIDAEIKRLSARKTAKENLAKQMTVRLQNSMETTGKVKFKTPEFSYNIQNNPASVVMDEPDVFKLPEEFLKYKDPEIDKKAVKAALERGDDLTGIAHLEQGRSLRIR